MKATLLRLLAFLATDLRQADLELLDKASLYALASQFHHWSIACDEAAKRPTRRSQTPVRDTHATRAAGPDPSTAFTLTARISA